MAAPAPTPEPVENPATCERVLALLASHAATFSRLTHPPTLTSAQSAAVRGVDVHSGAKAMLCKLPKDVGTGPNAAYVLCILCADLTVDWAALRALLGVKKSSLASLEDVSRLTGCLSGAVPPFGSLFGVTTLVDESIVGLTAINFNCGLRTESVCGLPVAQYLAIEAPRRGRFSVPPPPPQ